MPRSIRIEFPGAFYHLMARGNRREAIFHDDDDRRFFLATLAEACEKTGWRERGQSPLSDIRPIFSTCRDSLGSRLTQLIWRLTEL